MRVAAGRVGGAAGGSVGAHVGGTRDTSRVPDAVAARPPDDSRRAAAAACGGSGKRAAGPSDAPAESARAALRAAVAHVYFPY